MKDLLNNYHKYLIVVGICFTVAWFLFHSNPVIVNPDPNKAIKEEIKQETKIRDSVEKKAIKTDSVRIQYVIKWRKAKADTIFLPCDSVLHKVVHICDTLIQVDSTEISQLKRVNLLDSVIISDQAKIIKNDSIAIIKLTKQVKRSRFWGKAGTATGFVGGFVLGKL